MSDKDPTGDLHAPHDDINAEPITIPVLVLDKFTIPTITGSGPGDPGDPCTLTDVGATINCNLQKLTVNSISSQKDPDDHMIVKMWNTETGDLIDVIPVVDGEIQLPFTTDISNHFNDDIEVHVTYEMCGCCIKKEYSCECIIDFSAFIACGRMEDGSFVYDEPSDTTTET